MFNRRTIWLVLAMGCVLAVRQTIALRQPQPAEPTQVRATDVPGPPEQRAVARRPEATAAGWPQEIARPSEPELDVEIEALKSETELDRIAERILALWRAAADQGAPEEALRELSGWTSDPDPAIAGVAERAVADLERLRDSLGGENVPPSANEGGTPSGRPDAIEPEDHRQPRARRPVQVRIDAIREASAGERLAAVRELWRYAADHGAPRKALEELNRLATSDPDPAVAEMARNAASDLEDIAGRTKRESPMANFPAKTGVSDRATSVQDEPPSASSEVLHSLTRHFAEEASPDRRATLLGAIAGTGHALALDALVAASSDEDPSVRHEAVNLLWRKAADDPQAGYLWGALDAATRDPDPAVSGAAFAALADLRELATRAESAN